MLKKTNAPPPENPDWKNFVHMRRHYMRDRHGDPDEDFESYCLALSDGHSPPEIVDAAVAMTLTAIGKNGIYPWIPPLATFLINLPPPVSNVMPLRPE